MVKTCALLGLAHTGQWAIFDRHLEELLMLEEHHYAQLDTVCVLDTLHTFLSDAQDERRHGVQHLVDLQKAVLRTQ